MKAVPEVGGNMPVRIDLRVTHRGRNELVGEGGIAIKYFLLLLAASYIVVVFPAPLWPRKAVICPS